MTKAQSSSGTTMTSRRTGSDGCFRSQFQRLQQLEIWRELAVRPTKEECHSEDRDLLEREVDDLDELTRRCLAVRRLMNKRLPPHELCLDEWLNPQPSTIPNAGLGLFYATSAERIVEEGEILCYYCGHIHNFLSVKVIEDKSYLMLVSGDMFVDPGPLPSIKARYINDPLNEDVVNCKYIPQTKKYRSAVVATRMIHPGEELFASYGEDYWSRQDQPGTVISQRRPS